MLSKDYFCKLIITSCSHETVRCQFEYGHIKQFLHYFNAVFQSYAFTNATLRIFAHIFEGNINIMSKY